MKVAITLESSYEKGCASHCGSNARKGSEAMAADERQEEQQFLAELKARSGRNLADWMALIAAQNFSDKNETIDWLRAQGFAFARASWLERIHSNGGRPIYAETGERTPRAAAAGRKGAPDGSAEPRPWRGSQAREADGASQGLPAALPDARGGSEAGGPAPQPQPGADAYLARCAGRICCRGPDL